MPDADRDKYDAVIIGAGISGLVCGCYLAKAGMKVLIAEQHYKPGGYCSSFKRQGFTFDAAAHSFGAYREGGIVRKVFRDLKIDERVKIKRYSPSDIIITPDYRISFHSDIDKTILNFQQIFPEEGGNIRNFFHFLINSDPLFLARLRNCTFQDLLNNYFTDEKLKAILSLPLFGNVGLSPSQMSASMGVTVFVEFLLDGGYYPEGGMQAIPNALADRFKELGGELLLSSKVKTISIRDNNSIGIVLEKGDFIPSMYVVSNCDARQTFFILLRGKNLSREFSNKIRKMTPALSMFILYLGMDKHLNALTNSDVNIWFLSSYDIESAYISARQGNFNDIGGYLIHVSPDKRTLSAFVNTSFKNEKYWIQNKIKLIEHLIKRIELDAFPDLSKHVLFKEAATPCTLHRYTLNYKGSAYGWAYTPSQLAVTDLRKPPFLKNLYLTGHWTTHGFGIPGVTYIGYDTANSIVRRGKIGKSLYI